MQRLGSIWLHVIARVTEDGRERVNRSAALTEILPERTLLRRVLRGDPCSSRSRRARRVLCVPLFNHHSSPLPTDFVSDNLLAMVAIYHSNDIRILARLR